MVDDNIMTIDLRENTGSVSENLRSLPKNEENAVDVPFADAAVIRSLITRINKATTGVNAGITLATKKTETGIKVWRVS